jgi:hypothetical protein
MVNDRFSYTRGIRGSGDDCEPACLVDNKNIRTIDSLKNGSMIIMGGGGSNPDARTLKLDYRYVQKCHSLVIPPR